MMTEQEIIEVVKASLDGEQIQFKLNADDAFDDWSDTGAPAWDFYQYSYRVKPKPRVRPYTYDELKIAILKHGQMIESPHEGSVGKYCLAILGFDSCHVSFKFESEMGVSMNELSEYTWLDDGSPCGIVEDEEVQV